MFQNNENNKKNAKTSIALIGCGTMMSSLFWPSKNDFHFFHYNPTISKAENLAIKNGGRVCKTLDEIPESCEGYIIGVKPQVFPQITSFLSSRSSKGKYLVSLMAAIQTNHIHRDCGWPLERIGRCMSNIGSSFGLGVHVLYGEGIQSHLESYFALTGKIVKVKTQDQLDSLAPLLGSGPAYFFEVAKYLEALVGQYLDLQNLGKENIEGVKELRGIIGQLLLGAGKTIQERNDVDNDYLQSMVASKGGLTEQALRILQEGTFRKEFDKAMEFAMAQNLKLRK